VYVVKQKAFMTVKPVET